jgi:hypothetical protein
LVVFFKGLGRAAVRADEKLAQGLGRIVLKTYYDFT